jgi:DnaK suppressor protein
MIHLTQSQLAELRDELERQLKKLRKSMSVTDEALKTVVLDQTAVGRVSRMDSLQNQGIAQGLREREAVRLVQIQTALQRLSNGTYGSCTACGGIIAFERLSVFPESAMCAACSR